jgi:hypothetical protein
MDRIVAKSSGAARLDLGQAERRYFAIPILTFYEFINHFYGRLSWPKNGCHAGLFGMALCAGHRSRFFSGVFFGFVALHALLVHDLFLGKGSFLLQVLNGARLLGKKIMAEHTVFKRFLMLMVRKFHISLISGWNHHLFCPVVGFSKGQPRNPYHGGRDE